MPASLSKVNLCAFPHPRSLSHSGRGMPWRSLGWVRAWPTTEPFLFYVSLLIILDSLTNRTLHLPTLVLPMSPVYVQPCARLHTRRSLG